MNQNKVLSVRNLVLIAMFSALAAVLETIQVAVPFAPPFYKLDFAELPVLIGGFAMGPAQAALIAIVKNLLKPYSCFIASDPVSRYRCSTFLIRPGKATS